MDDSADTKLDAGREWMRRAWYELNAIRARDGAPVGVSEAYWSDLTEALGAMLGDDRVPWMTLAARKLTGPLDCEIVRLRTALAETQAREATLREALSDAECILSGWCKAIEENGTGWDDWDEWYKEAAYRGGLNRLRAALTSPTGSEG